MRLPRAMVCVASVGWMACGGGERARRVASTPTRMEAESEEPSAAGCTLRDEWTSGEVRLPDDSAPYAVVSRAAVGARLSEDHEGVRIDVSVDRGGWQLHGRADPVESLRARETIWFGDIAAATPGTLVTPMSVTVEGVRVTPGPYGYLDVEAFDVLRPIERVVGCDEIGFAFEVRGLGFEETQRVALGFAADAPTRTIPETTGVLLRDGVDGPPFLRIRPRDHVLKVAVLETRGEQARVLLQDWSGLALLGWVDRDRLVEEVDGDALGGLGVRGSKATTLRVCRSPEALLFDAIREDGVATEVGRIDAGTPFVSLRASEDGTVEVEPLPDAGIRPATASIWIVRPARPLSCALRDSRDL